MKLASSKITAQGQISVPAEIRHRLGVGPGSVLQWEEEGDRVVVKRMARYSFEDIHKKIFKNPPKPKTLNELNEGIREYMRKNHASR